MKINISWSGSELIMNEYGRLRGIVIYTEDGKEKTYYPNKNDFENNIAVPDVTHIANNYDRIKEMKSNKKNFYVCENTSWRGKTYTLYLYNDNKNVRVKYLCTEQERREDEKHSIAMYNRFYIYVYWGGFRHSEYSHTFYDSTYRQAELLQERISKELNGSSVQIKELLYLLDSGMLKVELKDIEKVA